MNYIIFSILFLFSIYAPAYSLQTDCTAYSADGEKIEIKTFTPENTSSELSLLINNSPESIIDNGECGVDLTCHIAKGYDIKYIDTKTSTGAILKLNFGETLEQFKETMRRDDYKSKVIEINPHLKRLQKTKRFYGTCSLIYSFI